MGKRVNYDGPGDDPEEYWFECDDCEGTGKTYDSHPTDATEGDCPGCGGLGFIEGDESDL